MKAVVIKDVSCVRKKHVDFSGRKVSDKPGSQQKQRLVRKRKKVENCAYLSGGFGVSSKPDSILSHKRVTIKFTDEKTS